MCCALLLGLLSTTCLAEYAVGVAGSELCPGIDLATDPDNCGDCGVVCSDDQACVQGVCSSSCDVGFLCERTCSDFVDDPLHCGSCDEACAVGEACIEGSCVDTCDGACDDTTELCEDTRCVCRPGFLRCNGFCTDGSTDPENCSECSMRCEGGVCADSTCIALCPDGTMTCGNGACPDLDSNEAHCGGCDSPCLTTELCVGGVCRGYHFAPCEQCPCDGCGEDTCCSDGPDTLCVAGGQCPS